MEKLNEVLARAWMVCDPNRQPCDPDELNFRVGKGSEFYGQPEWKWFVPRAEALRDFLSDNGFVIRPKEKD